MHIKLTIKSLIILLLCFLTISEVSAQKSKKKKKGEEEAPKVEKKETIASKVKNCEKIEGLFTFYRDTTSGNLMMEISKDQFEKEFIYFSQIDNGVLDASSIKGSYDRSSIFRIEKYYDRVELVKVNTNFYFDPENPLSRAKEANVSNSILASEKVVVEEDGKYLIKADNLFLKETLTQVKPPRMPGQSPTAFQLGNLDGDKTKIRAIRNYPENTDLKVEYVYSTSSVLNGGSDAVADARNVSISVYHSLIAMPENDYEPRFDDPRIGFFTTQVDDKTTMEAINYRDMIHRWHLVKKDQNEEVSEPVEPIVYWIENTTPYEFREWIKEGALKWNDAFEKAGFKNAVVVKVQPDTAEWEAGDIRYNVLRWTSSPRAPFNGYGPSFVNPRTGQILGADIMFEYNSQTYNYKYAKLLDGNNEEELNSNFVKDIQFTCNESELMQQSLLFGHAAALAEGITSENAERMKKEAMVKLTMHEVGHTLGLSHNMKASQLMSPAQLSDKSQNMGKPILGSIMDYGLINVTRDPNEQGHFYSVYTGPYDNWAIEFGYKPDLSDDERERLLSRSTEPQLAFGNDADDMRSSGSGIDPRVNTYDLSNDAITYFIERVGLINDTMAKIKDKFSNEGQSYQELKNAHSTLLVEYRLAADKVSRYIGGVYVDRAMVGQNGATKPYIPVSEKDQKRAMSMLSRYVFSPNAFDIPNDLYNYIASQRRGYEFYGKTEDPKVHGYLLYIQKRALNHLLHESTLQRIVDSELYGNTYSLSEFMTDLNGSIFDADINGSVNSFRQNLQIEYTKMLCDILINDKGNKYSNHAKSMVLYNLNSTLRKVSNSSGNTLTRAHKAHIKTIIENTLKDYKG